MNKKSTLELTALIFGAAVVAASIWFWSGQISNVLEILEMAYG